MKERIKIMLIAMLCALSLPSFVLLMYTDRQQSAFSPLPVQLCLERGEGFVATSYVQKTTQESDAVFRLRLQENYEVVGCSYPDYTLTPSEDGFTLLTLHHVRYPDRVTVRCEIPTSVILYDPNGGSFEDSGSTAPLRIAYGPSVHLRINTLTGAE